MPLEAGTKLGPYEVAGPIGAGGMGEVYRARDTKLNRDVALKVLPEAFVNDPERLARFQREAEVLASLNHPNIAQIYGLEDSGETTALVLELVEGPTLADRIAEGEIPLDEALAIAKQVAEALEAAHEQGIIHRDLKPANIKVTPDGVVKVLDFGLAKALEGPAGGDASESPTIATAVTGMGVIMGTAAYMSPEQARGKPVDRRADIWAFGVVVYEMLTGKRMFDAEDVSLTLAEVMKSEPEWDALPNEVSPVLRTYLERCLRKDPKERIRDIGDVRLAMEGAFETRTPPSAEGRVEFASRSVLPWVVATCTLTAAIVAVAVWNLKPAAPKAVVRFAHVLPDGQSFASNFSGRPLFSIAPDGSRLVYTANGRLFLRELDEMEVELIPGTDGAVQPFFSYDGEWVGFWVDNELKKVAVGGGAPVRLAADTSLPVGIDWSADDTIVYADEVHGLSRLPGSGGTPEFSSSDASVYAPHILDNGRVLVSTGDDPSALQVAVQSLVTGEQTILFPGGRPHYVSTGHIVFARGGSIFGIGFDLDTLKATGSPVPLVDGIDGGLGAPQFDVSETGTLVYLMAREDPQSLDRVLGLASRDGDVEFLNVPPAQYLSPRLSPDGERLVVQSLDAKGDGTLWVYELADDRAIQQFTLEGDNRRPLWTPDGQKIAFGSDREGTMSIYWRPSDGSGVAERLTTAEENVAHFPSSWSPDGKTLVYMVHRGSNFQTDWSLWTLSIDEGTTEVLLEGDGVYLAPELSPDGRWLTYTSGNISGSQDVYVEPFPPTGARRKISQDGAYFPTWGPVGDELFYRPVSGSQERVLNHVDITTAPDFGFSNERTLPIENFIVVGFYRDYDVTPDGERLLMVFPADRGESKPRSAQRIHIVLNWHEELKARVPTE